MPPAVDAEPPPANISASGQQHGGGFHLVLVHQVEAAGAGHHGREERMGDLVRHGHIADGPQVVPFHQPPQHGPAHQQDQRDLDGQLGVQVPLLPVQPVLLQHHHHREPQAAQENAHHQRDEDPQIGLVGDDAVRVRREAGVVERRNRVEHPVPDRLAEAFAQHQEPRDQRHAPARPRSPLTSR